MTTVNRKTLTNYERSICACSGSFITSLLVTPLDVVKTRMQSQSGPQLSTFSGLKLIIKNEGILKLWRGLSATMFMIIPGTTIYMVTYEALREKLETNSSFSYLVPAFSGSFSRGFAASIVSPVELLRTRLQQTGHANRTTSEIINDMRTLVRSNGILSLWRGLKPTLYRDIPFSALYWTLYDLLTLKIQDFLVAGGETMQLSKVKMWATAFLAGALSGMTAAYITTPLDVVKTIRQMDRTHSKQNISETSVSGILREIYRKEGFSGLMVGSTARIMKVAPSCAIMISTYELGKLYFLENVD